jgi:asparagine synthase (glutamine-hydrolysing)
LGNATRVDLATYLPDDILAKVDRASMAISLEVRAPWLDYRVIEFAFRQVPDACKASADETKVLPRLLARRLLPPQLDLQRKQGFSLPLATWFRGTWGSFVKQVLREDDGTVFDRSMIESLITTEERGYSQTARLFNLTMFELWRRHYRVSLR